MGQRGQRSYAASVIIATDLAGGPVTVNDTVVGVTASFCVSHGTTANQGEVNLSPGVKAKAINTFGAGPLSVRIEVK